MEVNLDENSTKACPLCCERINAKARKCPHCQHFQNKRTLLAYHPAVAIAPLAIMMAACLLMLTRALDPGESFQAHIQQVHVLHYDMQFGELKNGPTVTVVGTIENDSKIAWKEGVIEVRFYDKDHKLADVKQQRDYMGVLPTGISAFKVSMPREFAPEKYVSCEVGVIWAHDAHRIFP